MRQALLLGLAIAGVAALPALPATILGTGGSETIRGTAGVDRISAGAGDDRVYGLAGGDVLTGGPGRDVVRGGAGSDRILLRDGEPDTAVCGRGRDTALVDGADVVLADCETMRVLPPDPLAPPPRPVVPGEYGGRTTQGELVTFRVDSGGALTRLAFAAIHLSCADGSSLEWSHDFGETAHLVQRDGTFTVDESGSRVVAGLPASYRIVVSGLLTVGIATGSVKLDVTGATFACTSSGLEWTAAAATLTGP
jgi:RTX calcium-binding nonapeptide repeat (4 copies)